MGNRRRPFSRTELAPSLTAVAVATPPPQAAVIQDDNKHVLSFHGSVVGVQVIVVTFDLPVGQRNRPVCVRLAAEAPPPRFQPWKHLCGSRATQSNRPMMHENQETRTKKAGTQDMDTRRTKEEQQSDHQPQQQQHFCCWPVSAEKLVRTQ